MFAAVMAYAMGVKVENIRHGLRTFDTTYFQAPGRLNVFDELPFKVILDYGHNPAAIQAMANLVAQLEVTGRRITVLTAPGDRKDEDMREICKIAARSFDHFILRQDDDPRGRAQLEVPKLMEQALLDAGVKREAIEIVVDEQQAVERGLKLAKRGDLLLVFADKINRCWKQITKFRPDDAPSRKRLPSAPPSSVALIDEQPEATKLDGVALVRDERGVRLARELESED
jgi:cyanophycin synthetase